MKKKLSYLIIFSILIYAGTLFASGFFGGGGVPTLSQILSLWSGGSGNYLRNDGTYGPGGNTLSCTTGYPVLGTGQCGSNTLGSAAYQNSNQDTSTTADVTHRSISATSGNITGLTNLGASTGTFTNANITDTTISHGVTLGGVQRTTWPTGSGTGFGADYGTFAYYLGGNLGLGSNTPQSILDIQGASAGTNSLTFDGSRSISLINTDKTTNNMSGFDFRTYDASNTLTTASKIMGIYPSHAANAVSGDMSFLTRNAGTMTEKVRILSTGNVGIGTTAPGYKLDVAGSIRTTGDADGASYWVTDGKAIRTGVAGSSIYFDVGNALFRNGNASGTGATLRVAGGISLGSYYTTDPPTGGAIIIGNVGIGTTSPQKKLDIVTAAAVSTLLTDASNYERLAISGTVGSNLTITAERAGTGAANLDIILTPAGTGATKILPAGTVNHAVCWKTGGALGYCSDAVGANGTCTCN